MDFINNNFEFVSHYASTQTPQYNADFKPQTAAYTSPAIEKEPSKPIHDDHTDIIWVGKKSQVAAEFLVYGNKQDGSANNIAAILAKIVAQQTPETDVYIADLTREKRFLEEDIDLELGIY